MGSSRWRSGMQTARGSVDFDQFTDKMKELLKKAWGENWGTFSHDEPTGNDPSEIILPMITYDTYERVRSESHKSLEPIKFDRVKDESTKDIVDLYRMWFDVETDFKIYHDTNREARILMNDFEEFLWLYKSYFKEIGISDIIFLAEPKPQVVTKFQQEIPERTLRYLIRVERISTKRVGSLDHIDTVANDRNDTPLKRTGVTSDINRHYKNLYR